MHNRREYAGVDLVHSIITHFTSISAETDYPGAPQNKYTAFSHNGSFGNQLAWVEGDLMKAVANRANVIVGMHRPILRFIN
ncbi:hypothetical protein PC113_g9900 [Phytophthora cactorum]|uniref:Metallo-dependent phosphatase-like n=1 Tax=Phytophthora cactorum TaxID=29920 RepID=A0A8T1DIE9_9STRA|nr:hypothetical protein PC113_g9900 [Phytophthora cactorum]KAG2940855.1 hypothetical protein PC117_g10418 [Phytophthora cactorum]